MKKKLRKYEGVTISAGCKLLKRKIILIPTLEIGQDKEQTFFEGIQDFMHTNLGKIQHLYYHKKQMGRSIVNNLNWFHIFTFRCFGASLTF